MMTDTPADGPRYADLTERVKLRFGGPQRAWFLDQILTQSFEDMAPGDARDALMITAHGRLTGWLEVLATEDALLAHLDPALGATLPDEIRRYVFATQVEIEDVSDAYGLLLALPGPGDPPDGVLLHPTGWYGSGAAYLWMERDRLAAVEDALTETGYERMSADELETLRVRNAVPRWGYELDHKRLPQEVGLGDRAVHYDKGCYLGQEAMAKIHFRGRVGRRLVLLKAPEGALPGDELFLEDGIVGRVTSVAGDRALGIVKHDAEVGAAVTSPSGTLVVEREVS